MHKIMYMYVCVPKNLDLIYLKLYRDLTAPALVKVPETFQCMCSGLFGGGGTLIGVKPGLLTRKEGTILPFK